MSTALSLEQMRIDIATMLHEEASEIHDDDNLMDWGLDSMRAMTLAARWREHGARIEFADMAENATLSHWWSLVNASH